MSVSYYPRFEILQAFFIGMLACRYVEFPMHIDMLLTVCLSLFLSHWKGKEKVLTNLVVSFQFEFLFPDKCNKFTSGSWLQVNKSNLR